MISNIDIRLSDFAPFTPINRPAERSVSDQTREQAPRSMILQALEEPFQVLKPIPITIDPTDSGFVAGFDEAGIYASGETFIEAVSNLKYLLVDMYNELVIQENVLGLEPQRQLKVMQSYVDKHPDAR